MKNMKVWGNRAILVRIGFIILLWLFCSSFYLNPVFGMENIVYNAETEEQEGKDLWQESLAEFDTTEIQDFLDALDTRVSATFSFREMMGDLLAGNLPEVFECGAAAIKAELVSEVRTNVSLLGQMIVLAVIGAVFSGFAGIFGSVHVSETGFYVVYLLSMTFLAASFCSSMVIAAEVTGDLLRFMQVLLPAFFMAVTMAGGALTSAAVCGFTLGAIGLVQMVLNQMLLPAMRIYMLLVLAGNLYKEDMISKLTELMGTAVMWTCKTMFAAVVGFHVIQCGVLPQADAWKHMSAMRIAQMLPGAGAAASTVSQMVLGSGMLIKNTAGAAAVVMLLFLAAVPVGKLALLTVLYYLAAAVMEPVCDKRLSACMAGAANGHGLLLKIVGYSFALFAATIAVLCLSTNAVWYAG